MLKLLIIEDNWMMSHMIEGVANLINLDVIGIAASWEEAAQLLVKEKPNFAIVDININGSINGIEVAKNLKNMGIDFLFLTAYKDLETIQQATNLSPLSYLIKPTTPENIMATFLLIKTKMEKNMAPIENEKYTIDAYNMVYSDGNLIDLSKSEHLILGFLIKNMGLSVTYETLFHILNANNETTLRNIISKLRKKCPDIEIKNIKDIGYIASFKE